MRNIIVIGISSDIGYELAKRYLTAGCNMIGTYNSAHGRSKENVEYLLDMYGTEYLTVAKVDITSESDLCRLEDIVSTYRWDTLIISVCSITPVARFFECDFNEWRRSVDINFIAQMEVIHRLYKYRDVTSSIALLAGMGTNNAVDEQSAICVSKIALIKMVELIDYEYNDINAFIIGPGYVRTKIHEETLRATNKDSESYKKVKQWYDSGIPGTSHDDIYNHIEWCIEMGRNVCGGRNISTVHDCWGTDDLRDKLLEDSNMYKLRRYGNDWRERSSES